MRRQQSKGGFGGVSVVVGLLLVFAGIFWLLQGRRADEADAMVEEGVSEGHGRTGGGGGADGRPSSGWTELEKQLERVTRETAMLGEGGVAEACVRRLVKELRRLLQKPSECSEKGRCDNHGDATKAPEVVLNEVEEALVRSLLKIPDAELSDTQKKALDAVLLASPAIFERLQKEAGPVVVVAPPRVAGDGWSGTSQVGGRGVEGWGRDFEFDPRENNAIFISVVTFRDVQCPGTLVEAFARAARPDLVRIGLVQQNEDSDVDCFEEYCKKVGGKCRSSQVRVIRIKPAEARGVMMARGVASSLWSGERWYLQVDAHSGFNTHWDDMLINSTLKTGVERTILTHHPGDMAHFPNGYGDVSITPCMYKWDRAAKLPRGQSMNLDKKSLHITKPVPTIFVGAGTVFGRAQWIIDCPFDQKLHYIFTGEELLLAVCLFTKGWNLYAPDNLPVWHYYTRPAGPRFPPHHDESAGGKALLRLKYIFGHVKRNQVPRDYLANIEPFLMGNIRTRDEYWKYAALDFEKMTINQPFCEQLDFSDEALLKSKFPYHYDKVCLGFVSPS